MTQASLSQCASDSRGNAGQAARGFTLSMVPALAGLAIGLSYTFGATSYSLGTPGSPGPGLFPFFVGILIVLSSVIHLVSELLQPSAPPVAPGARFWRVPATALAIFAYAVLLKPAGFVIAAAVLCAGLLGILGRRRWWVTAALALCFSLAAYHLFQLLGVPLPSGPLPI